VYRSGAEALSSVALAGAGRVLSACPEGADV